MFGPYVHGGEHGFFPIFGTNKTTYGRQQGVQRGRVVFCSSGHTTTFFYVLSLLYCPFATVHVGPNVTIFIFVIIGTRRSRFFKGYGGGAGNTCFYNRYTCYLLETRVNVGLERVVTFRGKRVIVGHVALGTTQVFIATPVVHNHCRVGQLTFLGLVGLFTGFGIEGHFTIV